jgi:hypothetical protein
VFLEPWCVRTRMRVGKLSKSGGRCSRGGNGDVWKVRCGLFLSLGWSSPPCSSPFFWFCVEMGIFALMRLKNDIEILHINLYVFGSWLREKGEGVRTRKGCWHKKL